MDSLLQLFRSISDMMRGASEQAVRVKVGAGPQAAGGAGAGAGDSQPDAMRGWSARSGFGFCSQRAPPAGARAARLALPALTTCADHLCSRAGPRQGSGWVHALRGAPCEQAGEAGATGTVRFPASFEGAASSRPPTGRCSPWPPLLSLPLLMFS